MSDQRPRRVGIHGVRSAGKTCFLGSLYGFRSTPTLKLDVADDPSCNYLSAIWKDLSEGRVPGATLLTIPTILRLDLTAGDEAAVPLELCDYAGLLVQPREDSASPAAHQLTAEVKAWLRGCHALLLFLDTTQPDMEQIDALDLLLTELRRPGPHGHPTLDRPLGIVLTKWDSQGAVSDDLEREQERARAFLESHHVFRQIFVKLGDLDGNQVRLFPVSSFGNHARGNNPPALSHYHPFHVHAPIAWAAEVSDHVLYEETREKADRHLARSLRVLGLPVWPRPDHAAALREWRELKAHATPGHGPLAEEIDHEVATLEANRRQAWVRNLVPFAVAVGLLAVVGMLGAREAGARAEAALAYYRENTAYEAAADRLERAEAFLGTWSSRLVPRQRQELAEQAEADRRAVQEQQERQEFLDALAGLELREDWATVVSRVREYLDRYSRTPIESQLREREKTAAERDARRRALEEGAMFEQQDRYADALVCYRRFLDEHPGSRWKTDFDDLIRDAKRREDDRAEYAVIRQLVKDRAGVSLEEAGHKARAYLEGRHPVRAMRAEVEQFWRWMEKLRQRGQYRVIVDSVVVPQGSALMPGIGVTYPRVHLTINGVEHVTPWLRGSNTTPGIEVGPFPFRFGEPGKMLVRVEASRNFTRNPWARIELSDSRFILGKTNGTIAAVDEKGRSVLVGLRCVAALPPDLPPYRRR